MPYSEGGANIFNSQACLGNPSMFHAYTVTITIGYLTFDFLLTLLIMYGADFNSEVMFIVRTTQSSRCSSTSITL